MIWFTSDWHLDHENIIKYSNRPFSNAKNQEDVILTNFFNCVVSGDIVYHLGDFAFNVETLFRFIDQFKEMYGISVDFHYIEGNYDRNISDAMKNFAKSYSSLKEITWEKQPITLCHYIMYSFSKSHYNAWQLFGHHHSDIKTSHLGKRMNVGVDLHKYFPVNIDRVKKYMQTQPNNWDLL